MERLENEQSSFSKLSVTSPTSQLILQPSSFTKLSVTSPTSQLILQPFPRFTYVTAHSPTSSFSKLSVISPTSQLILQPVPLFTYVTAHPPTLPLLHLRHSSFSNPSFASPTSQDFHLRHLASRPCLPLSYPGQVRVHDRITLLELSFLTSGCVVCMSHGGMHSLLIDN